MCKLSQNIVPNVYNSLQSSFLSLAWPWPGRSLPKGNQWNLWDPQQEPLPGLGEVGHSPRGTQWECWDPFLGPDVVRLSPLATPNASLTPLHPLMPPTPPRSPQSPDATFTPSGP